MKRSASVLWALAGALALGICLGGASCETGDVHVARRTVETADKVAQAEKRLVELEHKVADQEFRLRALEARISKGGAMEGKQ